ncbi:MULTISPECIES: NAD-dependent epimerase/dehydratase family protein [Clostridium]|uniref:NAD-dependent epimerase/dehydratase family protein n=1 Tax=Clostridium TaxID=1485 RepID=UPI000824055E|nr:MULTISPECIES: NAD-dependent epimerase/dehydratase family protein [Clostridium]
MNNKILVTGSTGFIGACLVENLVKNNFDVNIIIRESSNIWRLRKVINSVTVHYADITDFDKVNKVVNCVKPDYIFHLATYGAYYYQQDDNEIIKTNIIGTKNLVDCCSKIDYKAFVNVGSSSEYGMKSCAMKESDILEPINVYGITKAAATNYCNMIYKTQGKPIGTVRLFSVYGKYEDKTRLIPSVILSCLRNENPKLANKFAVRDFIYVEDIVELLKYVAFEGKIAGKIYNAGSGHQMSIEEMASVIIDECAGNFEPLWGELSGRSSDTDSWEADMSLVYKELDWKPKYNVRSGIKESVAWFKKNIDLY